jgi:hypothetical protein
LVFCIGINYKLDNKEALETDQPLNYALIFERGYLKKPIKGEWNSHEPRMRKMLLSRCPDIVGGKKGHDGDLNTAMPPDS